jgi:hypothetical protein
LLIKTFPDPFLKSDGSRITERQEWADQRSQHLQLLEKEVYGHVSNESGEVEVKVLQRFTYAHLKNARQVLCQARFGSLQGFHFGFEVLLPEKGEHFPVVICGDANWRFVSDPIIEQVLSSGYALVLFNRLEFAPDHAEESATLGIYPHFPGGDFGAIAAWSWGYRRVIDALVQFNKNKDLLNLEKIMVTGHSRGGKASLLAGALDERITLTCSNQSGCGGSGSFLFQAEKSEQLKNILEKFPYWFSKRLRVYEGKEAKLPFDQHFLKSAVAPRALLTTESVDDLWANPEGAVQTQLAAQEVYQFLGAEEKNKIIFRRGAHAHCLEDWKVALQFADSIFLGKKVTAQNAEILLPSTNQSFTWRAPLLS